MLNTLLMIRIFKMTQGELKRFMKKQLRKYGYDPILQDGFIYAKGSSDIALLGHMDTVFGAPTDIGLMNGIMYSPQGLGADDRAGIYAILHLLNLGFRPTVLMLEDEECGAVGATKFVKSGIDLDVKVLIELDRQSSDDAVYYDCGNNDLMNWVAKFGFKKTFGSFSDISVIAPAYDLGAVNLSVGYRNQHSLNETLVLKDLQKTIDRVSKMLNAPPKNRFDYQESKWSYSYSYSSAYSKTYNSKWDDWDYDYDKTSRRLNDLVPVTKPLTDTKNLSKLPEGMTFLPLDNYYLMRPDGALIDLTFTSMYYMDEDSNVWSYYTGLVMGGIVYDEAFVEVLFDRLQREQMAEYDSQYSTEYYSD